MRIMSVCKQFPYKGINAMCVILFFSAMKRQFEAALPEPR